MKHKQLIIDCVKKSVVAAKESFDLQLCKFEQSGLSVAVDRAFNSVLIDYIARNHRIYSDNNKNEVDILILRYRKLFASKVAFAMNDALDECRKVFSSEMDKIAAELQGMIEQKG